MAVTERSRPLPRAIANLAESRRDSEALVLLPDEIKEVDGALLAGFRSDAQAFRAMADDAGLKFELAAPDGAKRVQYTERSADWVLPIVASIPVDVASSLVANWIDRRWEAWRAGGDTRIPVVRYRYVRQTAQHEFESHEIEGPASEVIDWLKDFDSRNREEGSN